MTRPTAVLHFDATGFARQLIVGAAALLVLLLVLDFTLVLGVGIATPDLQDVFDATHESGLMSFLCVTQVALIAVTLAGMAVAFRHAGLPRRRRLGWGALAVFFAYLALDDGTRFHEAVGSAFAASPLGDEGPGNLFPSYYWQLTLGPLFAAAGLAMLLFLWREMRSARLRALVIGAFGLLALAVAMDFAEGMPTDFPGNPVTALAANGGVVALARGLGLAPLDVVVHEFRAIEEALETLAFTLFWAAFLIHAARTLGGVAIRFTPTAENAPATAPQPTPAPTPWIARPSPRPVKRSEAPAVAEHGVLV